MGILDWFRSRSTVSSPDDLRAALFDALERNDYERAMPHINENSDRIRSEFRSWTMPPESLRGNTDALSRYVNTLMTIARVFEKSGDASLRICSSTSTRLPSPTTENFSNCLRAATSVPSPRLTC